MDKICIMISKIKDFFEKSAFGVCDYLGHKMGIASARVRIYFIYISFVAMGSPIILYPFAAFWLNVREYIRQKKSGIFE